MSDQPCEPVRDEIKWAPGFWLGLLALMVFAGIVIYQVAFIGGTRVSNELVAPTADADAEIRTLRVQLDEARRFQDTLLSVVLVSFGAGFTILVLVNIGLVVFAQRSQDREERYLRTILRSEAMTLDEALASTIRADARQDAGRIETSLGSQLTSLQDQVNSVIRSTLDQQEIVRRSHFDLVRLRAEVSEKTGNHAEAANHWARFVALVSDTEPAWQVNWGWMGLTSALKRMRALKPSYENWLADHDRQSILIAVEMAESSGKLLFREAEEVRELISAIEEKQVASTGGHDVPPPPTAPSTNPFTSSPRAPRPRRRLSRPQRPGSDSSGS